MPSSLVLRLLSGVSIFALHVAGQNSVLAFNWKFGLDANPLQVPICQKFPITVFPNPKNSTAGTYSGTPPYYMMAFPEGGQPITQHIGDTNDSLSWTPTHPVGTKFSLQLMDSFTNTGGAGGNIFEIVQNSQGQDCVASSPPQDFTLTSNITGGGKLETCHPWRLNINGGSPPYVIVLNAQNSPVITNITVPLGSDAVVYSNRADPNTLLFAAVVDKTGRWATGTQFISTFGTTDITCTGYRTIISTQEELNKAEKALEISERSHRTTIIIAVVASVVGVLLIGGGLGAWIHRRRKIAESLKPDIEPRQFMDSGPSGQILSVTQFMSSSPTNTPSPGKKAFSPGYSPIGTLPYTVEPFDDFRRESVTDQTQSNSSGHVTDPRGGPSFAHFPVSSVRRSGKGREAAQEARDNDGTVLSYPSGPSQSTSSTSHPAWPTRSASLQQQHSSMVSGMENEIIYQHRDAGQVVRELPPPYIPPQLLEDSGDERRTTTEA